LLLYFDFHILPLLEILLASPVKFSRSEFC